MYVDKELELAHEQEVTTSAASTNHIDQGASMDAGMSGKHLAITVNEAAEAAGEATVTFSIQKSDDQETYEDVVVSKAFGKDELVAGTQLFMALPVGLDGRFIRAFFTVGTGPLTAGKFSAQIVEGIQKNQAYADAL